MASQNVSSVFLDIQKHQISSVFDFFTKHSMELSQFQLECAQISLKLWHELNSTEFESKDYMAKDLRDNVTLNYLNKLYSIIITKFDAMMDELNKNNGQGYANKIRFICKLYFEMFSPKNHPFLNQDIIGKFNDTKELNLDNGYKNLIEDIKDQKGIFNIPNTKDYHFEIGKDIAITPGKVVYKNELIELIRYKSTTKQVYEIPLLIVPPWINKYYILDLQAKNSFVKWLVDQGYVIYLISWVNPDESYVDTTFDDYLNKSILDCCKVIKTQEKVKTINALGYCVGGTLLGCALAYLAKKKNKSIASATFLTSLLDFSIKGDMEVFTDEEHIKILESHMEKTGYLEGQVTMTTFNMLRAKDLVWRAHIDRYLNGNEVKPFDILYWNSDGTNIPYKTHQFYLREFYLHNNLVKPNKIKLSGTALDLGKVDIPSYFLAADKDHIVLWQAAYQSMLTLSGDKKFVLAGSGHVAGVINPPSKNKYSYKLSNKNQFPENPRDWLKHTSEHAGSWWVDYDKWLSKKSGKLKKVNSLSTTDEQMKAMIDAPGTYVRQKTVGV